MKRFHVHVSVNDVEASIRFYAAVFGQAPAVVKPDYAKWMLDDPKLNFAISSGREPGVNHLGFQVESGEELEAMRTQLESADQTPVAEEGVSCCYARSDKYWITDPAGIAWETFRSLGTVPIYGGNREVAGAACCITADKPAAKACC
jgi:catechol 2,3-dioxygenase-like lactoylglutathione lyase family enzyme